MRVSYCIMAAALDATQRCHALPDGFGHLDALLLPVIRQASDEVQEIQPAAKNAANGAKQHQLTVVRRRCCHGALDLLHHLTGTRQR